MKWGWGGLGGAVRKWKEGKGVREGGREEKRMEKWVS